MGGPDGAAIVISDEGAVGSMAPTPGYIDTLAFAKHHGLRCGAEPGGGERQHAHARPHLPYGYDPNNPVGTAICGNLVTGAVPYVDLTGPAGTRPCAGAPAPHRRTPSAPAWWAAASRTASPRKTARRCAGPGSPRAPPPSGSPTAERDADRRLLDERQPEVPVRRRVRLLRGADHRRDRLRHRGSSPSDARVHARREPPGATATPTRARSRAAAWTTPRTSTSAGARPT